MTDLSLEFKSNLQKLFIEKKFSELELEIENFGNIQNLPNNIFYLYAISKSINPESKRNDFVLATDLLAQLYKKNKKNLEPLYNLVVVSLKARTYKKTLKILNEAFEENPNDEKIIDGLAKFNYILANLEEAYKYYKLLFKINPNQILSRHSFLTLLNYYPLITQKEYLDHCKQYTNLIEKDLNLEFSFKKNKKKKLN